MPRQPRIDAPGFFHHVMGRGVNRQLIFRDSQDRTDFLGRLARALSWSGARCFAWALMPNHFHLLLQTGVRGLGTTMQHLLTGYALRYNRRHGRIGHLFQDRFKSILCEIDSYFRELVRYIHLNPVRAGLVKGIEELDRYAWTGHAVLMGAQKSTWQEVSETLQWWGDGDQKNSRLIYRQFVDAGMGESEPKFLEMGTGIRSLLGFEKTADWSDASNMRILGSSDFAARVLKEVEKRDAVQRQIRLQGFSLDRLCEEFAQAEGIWANQLSSSRRTPGISQLRARFAYRAVDELGWKAVDVARFLKITESSLSAARSRGRLLQG